MVGQPNAEIGVQPGLPDRLSLSQKLYCVTHGVHHLRKVVSGELPPAVRFTAQLCFDSDLLGLFLSNPAGDDSRVRTRLQRGAMLGELSIAFSQLTPRHGETLMLRRLDPLSFDQKVERLIDSMRNEQPPQPTIKLRNDRVLSDVDIARVHDPIRQGVLLGKAAPVVRRLVGPVALHPSITYPAEEQPSEDVRVARGLEAATGLPPTAPGEQLLDDLEVLCGHDRRLRDLV
nr:hypothetical protein [Streptosporangium lutulentum]